MGIATAPRQAAAVAITAAVIVAAGMSFALPSHAAPPQPKVSFKNQVMPIFQQYCLSCHSPGGVGFIATNMDLTSYRELRMGSVGGVTLIPFHADRSPLMRLLNDNWHSSDKNALKMPPLGPQLSPHDLKVIADWIDQGAKNN
jgi:mono/diheme cytochrome c family protein